MMQRFEIRFTNFSGYTIKEKLEGLYNFLIGIGQSVGYPMYIVGSPETTGLFEGNFGNGNTINKNGIEIRFCLSNPYFTLYKCYKIPPYQMYIFSPQNTTIITVLW